MDYDSIVKMNPSDRFELAMNPSTSNEVRDMIVKSYVEEKDCEDFTHGLGEECDTPELMDYCLHSGNEDIMVGLAENPNVTEDILLGLSECDNDWVLYHVASNNKTPKDVSIKLFERVCVCPDVEIRQIISEVRLPKHIYAIMAKDEDEQVRINIAENDRTPKEVLTYMADDKSEDVKVGLLYNIHTPNVIKAKLRKELE